MTSAAEVRRWAAEHVQPAAIGWDEHGQRVADDAPQFTSVRESWFHARGLGDMFRGDGVMWLDEARTVGYRRVRELPDGSTAYERFPVKGASKLPTNVTRDVNPRLASLVSPAPPGATQRAR